MSSNLAYQEDFCREELIGGKVVMMSPSPVWNHVAIAGNLHTLFNNFLRGKKCVAIQDGFDVHLTEEDIFVPDMMVVCDPGKIQYNGVYGAPDLVVEVLSPSTSRYDRGHKMQVYGQCGVREYWIVSPGDRSIEQYLLQDGGLVLNDIYHHYTEEMLSVLKPEERDAVATEFHCSLFDDLAIRLEDVFYRVK